MKPITLFTRPALIVYKHSTCSLATLLVLLLTVFTVLAPFYATFGLNGDLWMTQNQHRMELLQPTVRFPFRYVLIGEFRRPGDAVLPIMLADEEIEIEPIEGDDDKLDSHIRAFTSYSFLNGLLIKQQHSVSIKHWTTDVNYDGRADQIHLEFTFETPKNTDSMTFLSLYLELDARITSDQSCSLRIPAAVVIDRLPLSPKEITSGTELSLTGRLRFQQRSSFNCPNFWGKRQTFFPNLELIPANSTNLEDYSMSAIDHALRTNVGYLEFATSNGGFKWQANANANRPFDQRIRLNVVIDIDEIEVRYWTTFGQQMFCIWMEYLAVLVVLVVLVDRFKAFVFSRMWLRPWEIQPWKLKSN